jgi:hypothetical protein
MRGWRRGFNRGREFHGRLGLAQKCSELIIGMVNFLKLLFCLSLLLRILRIAVRMPQERQVPVSLLNFF